MTKLLSAVVSLAAWGIAGAAAQNYPTRPITMIVPFAAGGSTDIVARISAEGMKGPLGQTVVVENVAGASGTIGSGRVARADPDGYTLLLGQWSANVGAGALYNLPYHVLNDFEPISMASISTLWIMGRNGLPAKNLKELVTWLKANPGKGTVATVGAGSASHVCMVYFENATGTKLQYVPYRGAAPAMQDLVAEQVDLTCLEAGQSLGNYRAGKFKVYAIMNNSHFAPVPEVPTADEAGLPGVRFPFWHALWAPKGTPKPIAARLNAAMVAALSDPATQKRFSDLGLVIPPRELQMPDGLRSFHQAELDKWWPIIKAAGMKVQ
jgi:tripartite-type tricarboxylate transporter receptor subunit TctC